MTDNHTTIFRGHFQGFYSPEHKIFEKTATVHTAICPCERSYTVSVAFAGALELS